MSQMTDAQILTDDEVVAIGVRRSLPWPGGAPTVTSDEHAIEGAAFRGDRSLFVRGLLTDDDDIGGEIFALTRSVFDARGRILVYLGDEAFGLSSWEHASVHYPATDGWVLETITPLGVHRLSRRPLADHRIFLETLLSSVVEHGPARDSADGARNAVWLCVLSLGADGARLAAARRDSVVTGVVIAGEGGLSVDGALAESPVSTAIELLVSNAESS